MLVNSAAPTSEDAIKAHYMLGSYAAFAAIEHNRSGTRN